MKARILVVGLFLVGGCKNEMGPPPTGSALVTVTTSGPGADTTIQYTLSVDSAKGTIIRANISLALSGLSVGATA